MRCEQVPGFVSPHEIGLPTANCKLQTEERLRLRGVE